MLLMGWRDPEAVCAAGWSSSARHLRLGEPTPHYFLFDLKSDDPLGSSCLSDFKEMFLSQKVVEVASETFLTHVLTPHGELPAWSESVAFSSASQPLVSRNTASAGIADLGMSVEVMVHVGSKIRDASLRRQLGHLQERVIATASRWLSG